MARKQRGGISTDESNQQVVQPQELKDVFVAQQMTREEYVQKLNEPRERRKPVPRGTGFLCYEDFYPVMICVVDTLLQQYGEGR